MSGGSYGVGAVVNALSSELVVRPGADGERLRCVRARRAEAVIKKLRRRAARPLAAFHPDDEVFGGAGSSTPA